MSTWLLSEILSTWERGGTPVVVAGILEAAAEVTEGVTNFEVQDPRLMAPGTLPFLPCRNASWTGAAPQRDAHGQARRAAQHR